jgi:TRAP-type C4-dicarboxylate transport system substrate-binding protein
MEHESEAKLTKLGVKIVKDVDKAGFIEVSRPIQDQLAKQLGPNAEKILRLVREVK